MLAGQVTRASGRCPLLKALLERCLCLHAEDRPTAADAARAVEGLRLDPCAYRPAGHGAGVLADRWFKARVFGRYWRLMYSTLYLTTSYLCICLIFVSLSIFQGSRSQSILRRAHPVVNCRARERFVLVFGVVSRT